MLQSPNLDQLPSVDAQVSYIAPLDGPAQVRVFALSSGVPTTRPASQKLSVKIRDGRPAVAAFSIDEHGFALHASSSAFRDFYDEAAVRTRYYPEVSNAVREFLGAKEVIVFDHNVRSAVRAERGEMGVRVPVDQVHNDYTEESGPRRRMEILEGAKRLDLADHRFAFVNLWRPITQPVQDNPLALCDAGSVPMADFVKTDIHHFGEDDLSTPRHRGQIYSVRANPAHRWFFFSDMRSDEALLLKCYDSKNDGRARFMPHTGFENPLRPETFIPRESIEARTLVVFSENI